MGFRWGAWSISCARLDSVTCVWLWCVRETSWNLSLGNSWSRTSTAMPVRVMSIFFATCIRKFATYSIRVWDKMFKKWNETDGRADGRAKMDEDGDQIRWKKKIIFSFLFVCFVYPFGNNSKTNGLGWISLSPSLFTCHYCWFYHYNFFCFLRFSTSKLFARFVTQWLVLGCWMKIVM